jgi:hypothetical protein
MWENDKRHSSQTITEFNVFDWKLETWGKAAKKKKTR